jgi:hypothetical protein
MSDAGEGLQGMKTADLGTGSPRRFQGIQGVGAATVNHALSWMPLELGNYLGDGIIGSGDKDEVSDIGNRLFCIV